MATIKLANLEAIGLYARSYISEQLMEMPFATIETALSNEMAAMVMTMKGYIYGDNIDERIITKSHVESVPETWWDAFKLSAIKNGNPFFKPERIKYRLVTVTVSVELKKYWAFPNLPRKYYPKDLGNPIPFATFEERYVT